MVLMARAIEHRGAERAAGRKPMERDAKILSAIAGAILVVAIGVVAYSNFGSAVRSTSRLPDGGKVAPKPVAGEVRSRRANWLRISSSRPSTARRSRSSSLRGKVVFLNVWATWCGPAARRCRRSRRFTKNSRHEQDFVVLAVSQDSDGRARGGFLRGKQRVQVRRSARSHRIRSATPTT